MSITITPQSSTASLGTPFRLKWHGGFHCGAWRRRVRGGIQGYMLSAVKLNAAPCGAGFRRHATRGEGVWACKQHIKGADICGQLSIKESYLTDIFVRTLNSLLIDREGIAKIVGNAVTEALEESGGGCRSSP